MSAAVSLFGAVYRYPRGGFVLSCPRLELPGGEITVITGPNGSGKTTLSKLLCGIYRLNEGELRIFGEPANGWPLGKLGGRVGYLFQDPARQLFSATVWGEMTFADDILGRDPEKARQKAEGLLEYFGLSALKDRSTYRLSRGEKQRLAICAILMGGAEYLVLDEPTSGLDRDNRNMLYDMMDRLKARGRGFAVISHDGGLIARYGSRNIRVEEGRVLS
ncbi:MAG TPA: ABC transporter ATP-binding protein [Clostridiales bacterium]|nr:ABC transporter ATP-binding protein [Clostridiales bacterium]